MRQQLTVQRWRDVRVAMIVAALAVSAGVGAGVRAQPDTQYNLIIRGGEVLDGTGAPAVTTDIAVRGNRIVAVGSLPQARARTVIDAKGRYVAPGLIDVHSHAAEGLSDELNHGQPVLAQGITTVVLNPDGGGPIDIAAQRAGYEKSGIGLNVAIFVPHR